MPGPGTPPPGQPFGGNRMIRGGKGEEGGREKGGREVPLSIACIDQTSIFPRHNFQVV